MWSCLPFVAYRHDQAKGEAVAVNRALLIEPRDVSGSLMGSEDSINSVSSVINGTSNQSAQRKQNVPKQFLFFTVKGYAIILLALGLATLLVILQANWLPLSQSKSSTSGPTSDILFSEERALEHVMKLAHIAKYSTSGVLRNESHPIEGLDSVYGITGRIAFSQSSKETANYIDDEILKIRKAYPSRGRFVQINHQWANGTYIMKASSRGRKSAGVQERVARYENLHNVVVKVEGLIGSGDSILINAHYDSVAYSPGASDNGAMVAVGLEIVRALCSGPRLDRSVIILFNEAEECGLLGAHAFMSQHTWANNVAVVLNLDSAGGWGFLNLVRVGPKQDKWLSHVYAASVSRPVGTSVGGDVFSSGAIPSMTDFSIFAEWQVPSMDFVFLDDGYSYHTPHDDIIFHGDNRYRNGSLQHAGNTLCSLLEKVGSFTEKMPNRHSPVGQKYVFFDVLSIFVVRYSTDTASFLAIVFLCIFSACAVAVSMLAYFRAVLYKGQKLLVVKAVILPFCIEFCTLLSASILCITGGGLVSFLTAASESFVWYSSVVVPIVLYLPISFLVPSLLYQLIRLWCKWADAAPALLCMNADVFSLWTTCLLFLCVYSVLAFKEVTASGLFLPITSLLLLCVVISVCVTSWSVVCDWYGHLRSDRPKSSRKNVNDCPPSQEASISSVHGDDNDLDAAEPLLGNSASNVGSYVIESEEFCSQESAVEMDQLLSSAFVFIIFFGVLVLISYTQRLLTIFTPFFGRLGVQGETNVLDLAFGIMFSAFLLFVIFPFYPVIKRSRNFNYTSFIMIILIFIIIISVSNMIWSDHEGFNSDTPRRLDLVHQWDVNANNNTKKISNETNIVLGSPSPGNLKDVLEHLMSKKHRWWKAAKPCQYSGLNFKVMHGWCLIPKLSHALATPELPKPTMTMECETYDPKANVFSVRVNVNAPFSDLLNVRFNSTKLIGWSLTKDRPVPSERPKFSNHAQSNYSPSSAYVAHHAIQLPLHREQEQEGQLVANEYTQSTVHGPKRYDYSFEFRSSTGKLTFDIKGHIDCKQRSSLIGRGKKHSPNMEVGAIDKSDELLEASYTPSAGASSVSDSDFDIPGTAEVHDHDVYMVTGNSIISHFIVDVSYRMLSYELRQVLEALPSWSVPWGKSDVPGPLTAKVKQSFNITDICTATRH
eukprot:Nk52_evm3s2596 gene=Nk52_evmTU3s2596